ncbi:hypothetical protein [Streptomyces sp. NPDC002463]|uniref:hypothetical protein n=1 Tax=Streptomyces sp. NPDC002463 TaxID=3364645 RepID=UPI00369DB11A
MHAKTRTRRTAVSAVLCAAFALGTAACGPFSDDAKPAGPFGGMTGSQIVDKAFAATRAAKSVTVDVDLKSEEPTKGYLSVDTRGKCAGTVSTGTASTTEVIKVDEKDVYLRFDETFLREQTKGESAEVQEAMLKELKGKWVKAPVSDPENKEMAAVCDLQELLGGFEQGASGIAKGAETTVDGQKALALTEPGDGGETNTVYVATQGAPYILRIVTKGGDEPGTITFSKYGKPVDAKAPEAKDVVVTG